MHSFIVYPFGTDQPGVTFSVANGFVDRVVSAVAENNIPDAECVARILNDHFAKGGSMDAPHFHVRSEDDKDACAKCGRDLRDEIHLREPY